MRLGFLQPTPGSRQVRKRIGRGQGSGIGGTSGKGHKGYKARAGTKHRPWREGGQMPLQRRLPKRGFSNVPFRKEYQIVALGRIITLGVADVTPALMAEKGLVSKATRPVKVLGGGNVTAPVTVTANAFSRSAREAIEKAGGRAVHA